MRSTAAAVLLLLSAARAERFDEHVDISLLPNQRVLAHFTFTTTLESSSIRQPHYTLFPLGLGQILTAYDVSELHLAMNAGQWDYSTWGTPPEQSTASGAEMWAWMRTTSSANATVDADSKWASLRSAIGGIFCASLGGLDDVRTTVPAVSFRPSAPLPGGRHQLRHATLPAEHVCTENLTPFIKLLPCKASSGIASLLNPHAVFAAPFHGLGVHFARGVLTMSVQAVFHAPLPDWSFRTLLERRIFSTCPVASSSTISLTTQPETTFEPQPEQRQTAPGVVLYDLITASLPFDLSIKRGSVSVVPPTPAVLIQRTMTGSAQYNGGLLVQLINTRNETMRVVYLETLPWFVTLYVHSIEVRADGVLRKDLLETLRYSPSLPPPKLSPTRFEPTLRLPPLAKVALKCSLDRAFLLYTQHPPDAQRGWDLPPAVVTILPPSSPPSSDSRPEQPIRIYAKTLLADLPTPDFSMPFNVIIMSSTLIALMFGQIFNLLTRTLVIVPVAPTDESDKTQ